MTAALTRMQKETYLPRGDEAELATVANFMRAHPLVTGRAKQQSHFLLLGADGDRVELPKEIYQVLLQVVEAMGRGLAVTVVPQSQTLTTQQAADILGISRPTLIRILDANRIPFEKVGTHRKLLLREVLEFREKRRQEQYDALSATSISLDDVEDVDEVLVSLREARAHVASKRQTIV